MLKSKFSLDEDRASMPQESEPRQHDKHKGQENKHIEINSTENSNAQTDKQKRRRRSKMASGDPEHVARVEQYGDECRGDILIKTDNCNVSSKKIQPKTDKEMKRITRDLAIKYLQKLKHFTKTFKKTGVINLSRNIVKIMKKLNVNRASTASSTDSQPCNLKRFPSNTLYNSFSNISFRREEKLPDEVYESNNPSFPLTFSCTSILNSKINYFFKSQNPEKNQRKETYSYGCQQAILNFSFRCECDSRMVINEKRLYQSSSNLRASFTTFVSSTETSSHKKIPFLVPKNLQRIITNEKPPLKCVYSQHIAEHNGSLIQYGSRNSKTKSRRFLLDRYHRRLMNKMYRQNLNQKYQMYFAELDYNNLVLEMSQTSRQAVGIGSTCDFSIDFGRSTIAESTGIHDHMDTAAPSPSSKSKRGPYECSPGVCIPDKCEPSECFKRLKNVAPYGSHASTQSPKYEIREQKEIKGKVFNRKSATVIANKKGKDKNERQIRTRRGMLTQGVSRKRASRIGSKLSFNIQFYKDSPLDLQSVKNKQRPGRNKVDTGKSFACDPGVCVPGECDPKKCYKRIKASQVGIRTDKSLSDRSFGTSHSSQTSAQSRKLKKELREGKETLYKEKGTSSMPRPKQTLNIPNRQAVRIGSKCSFNIEFYKAMPYAFTNNHPQNVQPTTTSSIKSPQKTLKPFECEPGVCIPGKCYPIECFQRIKARKVTTGTDTPFAGSSNTTSHGSQASTKTRKGKKNELRGEKAAYYKEKGTSSMPRPKQTLNIPNRQAVRIGSKCSFNIEFYKAMPYAFTNNNPQNVQPTTTSSIKSAEKNLKPFECEPGVCIPGKCYPIECFQRIKARKVTTGTDTPLAGSSNTTSHGSQASTKTRKGKKNERRGEKATYYKEKGASSMPRAKNPLHVPNRQAVRIGSKCSFNIEFYKSMPHTGNAISGANNQPAMALTNKINTDSKGRQRQKAATRKNIKTIKPYECEPGVCIPGRCDPNECFLILKTRHEGSGTDASLSSSSNGASHGSQASNKMHKQKTRVMKTGKASFYKDKGAPSMRQPRIQIEDIYGPKEHTVRIGSKCSFNIEFYKSTPLGFNNQDNPPVPTLPNQANTALVTRKVKKKRVLGGKHDRGDTSAKFSTGARRNKNKALKRFQLKYGQGDVVGGGRNIMITKPYVCEPGVCIPDKCDPNECFARLKTKHEGTITDASLAASSNATLFEGQASTQTKKRNINNKRKRAGKETFYKDRAASTLPRSKMPLHLPNRQVVRIGSKCSFNVEFYKDLSKNGPTIPKQIDCEPGVCIPNKCDPKECFHRLTGTPWVPTIPKQMECKPGVCTPSKCDPKECFQRLTGTPWVPKQMECKPGVCTPSKCDPKECFQRLTGTPWLSKPMECEPGVCTPSKCDPKDGFQRLTGTPWVKKTSGPLTSEPSKDQQVGMTKKDKKASKGKKQSISGPKVPETSDTAKDKQGTSEHRSASGPSDKTFSENKTASSTSSKAKKTTGTEKKSKTIKGKIKIEKPSPKKYDHDDAAVQYKDRSKKKDKKLKEKTKPEKPSRQRDVSEKQKEIKPSEAKRKAKGGTKREARKDAKKEATKEAKKKAKKEVKRQADTEADREDEIEAEREAKRESKTEAKKEAKRKAKIKPKQIKPSQAEFDQDDNQLACEIGVCIPDKCDPNECFERLKSRHEGTSTDASLALSTTSLGSDVGTQSKIAGVNLGKKSKTGRKRREGKEYFVKEQGTSSLVDSNKKMSIKDIPPYIPRRSLPRNKQVVRIGSTCSFNISFYKELPQTGSQINRNNITIAPRSASSDTQTRDNKGIVPFIKKCYCQINKQKSLKNKKALMLYDQGSNTDEPMLVPLKNGTMINPTMQRLECEPGVCVYGKCDPRDCYQRLKPRHGSLNSIRLQSAGPGRQRNNIRRYECRFGVCFPNKCDPNESFVRERSYLADTGTDTSPRVKSTATYGTNAATQSRRYPGLPPVRNDPFRSTLCKCVAKIGPSTPTTGIRKQIEQLLAAQRRNPGYNGRCNCHCMSPNIGFGDNVFKGRVKEKAVILGSGCNFNIKYFGKKNKKSKKLN